MIVIGVRARRRGAVAVETAVVMLLVTTFVFGIFEYCRLLMDMNLLNNATREGCRYALANNTNTSIDTAVKGVVTGYLGNENASFKLLTVTVSGTHNGVTTAVNNLAAGDMITVTVTSTYKFMNVVPTIAMPNSLPVNSQVTMGCEGGT